MRSPPWSLCVLDVSQKAFLAGSQYRRRVSVLLVRNQATLASADEGPSIDLFGLVRSLKEQGLQTPCLFRFPEIVNHRLSQLQHCFDSAVRKFEYAVRPPPPLPSPSDIILGLLLLFRFSLRKRGPNKLNYESTYYLL